jgi:hypothetical protein
MQYIFEKKKRNISAIFCSFTNEDRGYVTILLLWIQEFRVRILTYLLLILPEVSCRFLRLLQ